MPELYIGLMSGTSADAIDAALLDCQPVKPRLLATHTQAIPKQLRDRILELYADDTQLSRLGAIDAELGKLFASAALNLIKQENVDNSQVTAIGCHGQTIFHNPDGAPPFSMQIGDANVIAQTTGITIVSDFRRRDIAAGGQGAPLTPAFHALMFRSKAENRAVLNLGGIANLTYLPADTDAHVRGFDCGPGNALLDAWIKQQLGRACDEGGQWAASGKVDLDLLRELMQDPYFDKDPPKSTGREYFNLRWLQRYLDRLDKPPAAENTQITLVELTIRVIVGAIELWASDIRKLLVCGGGIHNEVLYKRLRFSVGDYRVESTEDHGMHPDWVEAAAFAWLAKQTLARQFGNIPSVTGASASVILGAIYPGKAQ